MSRSWLGMRLKIGHVSSSQRPAYCVFRSLVYGDVDVLDPSGRELLELLAIKALQLESVELVEFGVTECWLDVQTRCGLIGLERPRPNHVPYGRKSAVHVRSRG